MEIGSASMEKYFKLKLLKLFNKQIIAYHYGLTEASRSSLINLEMILKKSLLWVKPLRVWKLAYVMKIEK